MSEALTTLPGATADDFDEAWYLAKHPDVAAGVARGDWKSGREHYERTGKSSGRLGSAPATKAPAAAEPSAPPPTAGLQAAAAPAADPTAPHDETFNTEYYATSYPLAVDEVRLGVSDSLEEHYHKIGRHRGYLPNPHVPRMEIPNRWASRFGGFWTDQANALDILNGRLDLGFIKPAHARHIRKFIEDGYIIIENAIPKELLDRAEEEFDRAFSGGISELLFLVMGISGKASWMPEALAKPAKALDVHWLSPVLRDVIFSSSVLDILHVIFERRVMATQTLGFWRGSQQDAHQDSAYVNYSHPMQFAASWIALEDVSENSGELFYYPGSQKLPEYFYMEKYKGVEEAGRLNPKATFDAPIRKHVAGLPIAAAAQGLRRERFLAKRGDVLIWAADLAHGGSRISTEKTRKSIVTHYCPAEAVPSYFENSSGRTIERHGGAFYSSGHYRFSPLQR